MTTHKAFWSVFETTGSINERIQLIRTTDYDLTTESQPGCMTTRFDDVATWAVACKVASAMIYRMGTIMVEAELSSCRGSMTTIADPDGGSNPLIVAALREMGCLPADERSPRDLLLAYNYIYRMYDALVDDYYTELNMLFKEHKAKFKAIQQELIEALCHPSRLQKWLDAGNDHESFVAFN